MIVKTIELPDNVFKKLEALRRSKRVSRVEALSETIDELLERQEFSQWWQGREETSAAQKLSQRESDELATRVVRQARRERSKRFK